MNAFDKIKDAANFAYKSQGYIDIHLISKMVNIPELICKNVIEQCGYIEAQRHGQYFRPRIQINKE